ncbi:MAG: phosphoribosylformylglycinamidine cyclo-ligase [Deltaproteobacteria bacterium]|nr:phosphoribosylformylglycinamidine cyclo-ligase [Deltaproteobacteria bacterium]
MVSRKKAYKDAGVDIDAGKLLVDRIKKLAGATHVHEVLSDIGGFGGLFKLDLQGMEEPVLVASTDGVGTKLKLAVQFDRHDGVGIDLVAMCANDILVQGAKPLFFLDYFATAKLDVDVAERVIAGIAAGCRQAGCALLGGETAEMPSMYAGSEYDLAGFCVGVVDNSRIVDGSSIRVGDTLIGLASSGIHANGFSLVRKILTRSGLGPDDQFPGAAQRVRDVLLTPTAIYVDAVRHLMRDISIKGMVHVTGGGFHDNIPRILPAQVAAAINFGAWNIQPEFHWLREQDGLSWAEMLQVFNCGIGFILIAAPETAEEIVGRLAAMQIDAWIIGSIERRHDKNEEQVRMVF